MTAAMKAGAVRVAHREVPTGLCRATTFSAAFWQRPGTTRERAGPQIMAAVINLARVVAVVWLLWLR
jgi:hypothetical protein